MSSGQIPPLRDGDLVVKRGPAVIGPDVLGFALTALFAALPIWIGRGTATPGLHGSAGMIWIMAALSTSLLIVGASGSCFRLRLEGRGLTLIRLQGTTILNWSDLIGWRRGRRGLPSVLRKLVPILPPTPAGAILIARDSTGIELLVSDGRRVRIPHDGFEQGEAQLLKAMASSGVRQLRAR